MANFWKSHSGEPFTSLLRVNLLDLWTNASIFANYGEYSVAKVSTIGNVSSSVNEQPLATPTAQPATNSIWFFCSWLGRWIHSQETDIRKGWRKPSNAHEITKANCGRFFTILGDYFKISLCLNKIV